MKESLTSCLPPPAQTPKRKAGVIDLQHLYISEYLVLVVAMAQQSHDWGQKYGRTAKKSPHCSQVVLLLIVDLATRAYNLTRSLTLEWTLDVCEHCVDCGLLCIYEIYVNVSILYKLSALVIAALITSWPPLSKTSQHRSLTGWWEPDESQIPCIIGTTHVRLEQRI